VDVCFCISPEIEKNTHNIVKASFGTLMASLLLTPMDVMNLKAVKLIVDFCSVSTTACRSSITHLGGQRYCGVKGDFLLLTPIVILIIKIQI